MIQNGLIELGTKFLKISEEEFKKRIEASTDVAVEDWKKKESIVDFYKTTDIYIYKLVNFNTDFRLDNLIHPIKYIRNLKILDYGAGIGIIPILLAKYNTTYYYDLESRTKEFARFINNNAINKTTIIDDEDEAFRQDINTIICVDVLEHLEDPMALVKRITEKLPDGGLFLTTGLNFSIGTKIPMHLPNNTSFKKEYDKFMGDNYNLIYYHPTKNEVVYLWEKK